MRHDRNIVLLCAEAACGDHVRHDDFVHDLSSSGRNVVSGFTSGEPLFSATRVCKACSRAFQSLSVSDPYQENIEDYLMEIEMRSTTDLLRSRSACVTTQQKQWDPKA
jgi:hypothetical protein